MRFTHEKKKSRAGLGQSMRVAFMAAIFYCATAQSNLAQSSFRISVLPELATVQIEGENISGKIWSFRKSYASVMDLGSRIERFSLFDANGKEVAVHVVAPGEYDGARPASRLSYRVKLELPAEAGNAAIASWIASNRALLML